MHMRTRAVVAVVAVVGVAALAWSCDQYVLGNRCADRLHEFQNEPVLRLPPDTVEVGRASQRPRCGIVPVRGFSERRLASTMSQEALEAWYKDEFGATYGLSRLTERAFGGIVRLHGSRGRSGHTINVSVDIGTRASRPIFPRDAHVQIPDGAQSTISVEVGDP